MERTHAGFEFVKEVEGVSEFKLSSNGLTLLLSLNKMAPTATIMVTYRVGSRNEALGYTGSTHILEHMMFKGSKNFNKENGKIIWSLLETKGAMVNATTWNDRTNYFELLPKEHLPLAIEFEADRMRGLMLSAKDLETEMTVVRSEYEIGENSPAEALDKAIWATAYQAHPYHHSTIGWKSDIENANVERLKDFYDTYYWPENATLTIIGDFDAKEIMPLILKSFGAISKSGKPIPEMRVIEPEQEGERRVSVERAGETDIVGIAFKAPPGIHEDRWALDVLEMTLGANKTGRLYKALVEKGLASQVSASSNPFHDNSLFTIYATLTPDTSHEKVEKVIMKELELLQKKAPKDSEIKKYKDAVLAGFAYSRDGSYGLAQAINESIALGDWSYIFNFREVANVKGSDLQRMAKKYFWDDKKTVGYYRAKRK